MFHFNVNKQQLCTQRFTSETLVHGLVINILERNALKIDFMGLVEEDWMDTLGTVDKNDIKYIDYVETADRLSAELRDKGADLGIALTHLRWRNGIRLARCGSHPGRT